MSPTSYQTAPPRINVERILHLLFAVSRVGSLLSGGKLGQLVEKCVECFLFTRPLLSGNRAGCQQLAQYATNLFATAKLTANSAVEPFDLNGELQRFVLLA